MYGDNLGKEKVMLDVIGSGIRKPPEWTQENTVGDPLGMIEPTKKSKIKSILYWIVITYMWLCTLFTTGVIIYALKG
jgi:hypothetical protein